jgi:hypothetical protein
MHASKTCSQQTPSPCRRILQCSAGKSCSVLQENPALLCRTILHSFYTRDLHKDSALLFLHNRYTMRLKPSTGHANVTAICNELGGLVAGPRRFSGICNTRLSTVSERDASTSSVWCAGPQH